MKRAQQPFLLGFERLGVREFGGSLIKGNPREARPIALKRPMHLVMRSTLATGGLSFLHPVRARKIEAAVLRLGRKSGVRVYRFSNSGNHLHLVILPRSRVAFRTFVRAITGIIARITLGAERGNALGKKFWDARPYTRILEWGREFKIVAAYVRQNTLEALGFIPYQPRKHPANLRSAPA